MYVCFIYHLSLDIISMTQEDKDLLLKDLCARLPYHPIVAVAYNYADKGIKEVWDFDVLKLKLLFEIEEEESWEYIKPYLRPMNSMTEEEASGLGQLIRESWEFYDYLNAHHFDYRGLIEKGLAIPYKV